MQTAASRTWRAQNREHRWRWAETRVKETQKRSLDSLFRVYPGPLVTDVGPPTPAPAVGFLPGIPRSPGMVFSGEWP